MGLFSDDFFLSFYLPTIFFPCFLSKIPVSYNLILSFLIFYLKLFYSKFNSSLIHYRLILIVQGMYAYVTRYTHNRLKLILTSQNQKMTYRKLVLTEEIAFSRNVFIKTGLLQLLYQIQLFITNYFSENQIYQVLLFDKVSFISEKKLVKTWKHKITL